MWNPILASSRGVPKGISSHFSLLKLVFFFNYLAYMGMRILEFIVLWVLGCALGGASVSSAAIDTYQKRIQEECGFTRYPTLCVQTLVGLDSRNQHVDLMSALVDKIVHATTLSTSDFANFSSQFGAHEPKRAASVTGSNRQLLLVCTYVFVFHNFECFVWYELLENWTAAEA